MSTITEYLSQLQTLTNQNLSILSAISETFTSKSSYVTTEISDETYYLPSFIQLENKLNTLEENFDNLVDAPKTGEAIMVSTGGTQRIVLNGYSNTPADVSLSPVSTFGVESNDILKDFLTPRPYINFDMSSVDGYINQFYVKKLIIKNEDLIGDIFANNSTDNPSIQCEYSDIYKKLYNYTEDKDYVDYDTLYNLPYKKPVSTAVYTVAEIISDTTDEYFDEYITVTLNESLTYWVYEGTIERNIEVGNYLVTSDDKVMLEVTDLNRVTNQLTLKVLNGAYVDLSSKDLMIYNSFETERTLSVTLEEDRYVLLFVSAFIPNTHVVGNWSTGIAVDVHALSSEIDGKIYNYEDYYNLFVNNLGDAIMGISSMISDVIDNIPYDEYSNLISLKPSTDQFQVSVMEINNHINTSTTIASVYSLYNQKSQYKTELDDIQTQIDELNTILQENVFTDAGSNRSLYTSQLTALNAKKTELNTSISSVVSEIVDINNQSVIPLEDPKYRIRGYFDVPTFETENGIEPEIIKINVQYRYKDPSSVSGKSTSIDESFIFSDWNTLSTPYRRKLASYDSNTYIYAIEEYNGNVNEPSYNQIDIPITQGETVDVKVQVVYEYGYPFVELHSEWSDVLNIEFPEEYTTDISVSTIVEESSQEYSENQFTNILISEGIDTHVGDNIVDQDITYFHKPTYISSGFYTDERRIIPLYDKLLDLSNKLTELEDSINGTSAESLTVTVVDGDVNTEIYPYISNEFVTNSYNDLGGKGVCTVPLVINIKNSSTNTLNLYSMFPGSISEVLNDGVVSKYDYMDYIDVPFVVQSYTTVDSNGTSKETTYGYEAKEQVYNQLFYMRVDNPYSGLDYYSNSANAYSESSILPTYEIFDTLTADTKGCFLSSYTSGDDALFYPLLSTMESITTGGDSKSYSKVLNPGESVDLPMMWEVQFSTETSSGSITKTIAFDVRTSLYSDPITYILSVTTYKEATLIQNLTRLQAVSRYNVITI